MAVETAELVILIVIGLVIGAMFTYLMFRGRFATWKARYQLDSKDIMTREIEHKTHLAVNGSRYALRGQMAEKLAPLAPEFISKYEPSDAHFLGMPVDYVIFKNLSKQRNNEMEPLEIVFLEVKTGKGQLSDSQTAVKDAVDNRRVKFEILRLDEQ